jgi:hypothetical protein
MVMRKMARAILLGGMAMAGVVLLSGPPRPAAMVGLGTGLKRFPAEVFIPLQRCAILERVQFLETLGHLQPLPAPAVLPLEQVGEHLLVRTRLSGVAEPIPLILDSGVRALILQRSRLPRSLLTRSSCPQLPEQLWPDSTGHPGNRSISTDRGLHR